MPPKLHDEEFSIGKGMLAASPIVMGYFPVAFALGILAAQLDFSALQISLFSALSFSGSGQSISLRLLSIDQSLAPIVSTIVIINLRYALMSAALAPALTVLRPCVRYAFGLFITDELFALHSNQFKSKVPPAEYLFAVNLTAWTSWVVGSVLGFLIGDYVSDIRPYGFDFAVPAMFIALLVIQIENFLQLALGVLAALLVIVLSQTSWSSWSVILTTFICATCGMGVELWIKKRRSL